MVGNQIALVTYYGYPHLTESDKLLVKPLQDLGFDPQAVVWNDKKVDWSKYSCIVIRSCWDYHYKYQQFLDWLSQLEKANLQVWNSIDIIRWNSDKKYLIDLENQGVAIIPTFWVNRGKNIILKEIYIKFNVSQLIIKPTVGAYSYEIFKADDNDYNRAQSRLDKLLVKADVMIQPFMDEVLTEGEFSFVFINGKFSHAVLKRPKKGDFRSIIEFGASETKVKPNKKLLDQANSLLKNVKSPLLYARVDGINHNGKFQLMELELIEPHLFFDLNPYSPILFARALKERAS